MNRFFLYSVRQLLRRRHSDPKPTDVQAVVLMFHRVAEPPMDPFGLAVTPQTFERLLEELRRETEVLSPQQFVEMIEGNLPPGRYSLITFDDGYEDVVANALPILRNQKVGAVWFIPSRILRDSTAFWWDILAEGILISRLLPVKIQFIGNGQDYKWEIPGSLRKLSASEAAFLTQWNWGQTQESSPRARLFNEIWEVLQALPVACRDVAVENLAEQIGLDSKSLQTSRLASRDQLMLFGQSDNCALGAHTINHVRLSGLSEAQQKEEITGSKADISAAFSTDIALFSYPHGGRDDFTAATAALVQQAGYRLAFSTMHDRVKAQTTNPYAIPRLYMHNGSKLRHVFED